MDATLQAVAQAQVATFSTAGITNFGLVIPVAGSLLIGVAIVYFVINHFRGLSHV